MYFTWGIIVGLGGALNINIKGSNFQGIYFKYIPQHFEMRMEKNCYSNIKTNQIHILHAQNR